MHAVDTKVNPGNCGRAAMVVALLIADDEEMTNSAFTPLSRTTQALNMVVALVEASIDSRSFPGTSYFPQVANTARGLEALSKIKYCRKQLKLAGLPIHPTPESKTKKIQL
eukprot:c16998_g1_i2.p2 GENE.c16998_g1_i2~~c16998_g1_i2.p2  ORF type:complete len:111 (+),score=21.61 c16998_g1_i2:684-1016(+)